MAHHEEEIDPQWQWKLEKTGENEWRGSWQWAGDGEPPIPPDRPPH